VNPTDTGSVRITRLSEPHDLAEELAADVRAGLTDDPKWMPPKYFYDGAGSELFEAITELPEYYPTRAETQILERIADGIVREVQPEALVELGSGSSRKTVLLLEAMHRHGTGYRYVPVDVSEDALRAAADVLGATHPWLVFDGFVGDFATDLHRIPRRGRRLVGFLGSTIGNFEPADRALLLDEVRSLLEPGDRFLLGADLVKDPGTLVAAYDDSQGVTAAFNRNMLRVLQRLLEADVDPEDFRHVARWNDADERIEMHLQATRTLEVTFPTLGLTVPFEVGETIRTELSCKFRREGIEQELRAAGLRVDRWETDRQDRFALLLAAPVG